MVAGRQKSGRLSGWDGTNGEVGVGGGRMTGCRGTFGCRMSYLEEAIGSQIGLFPAFFQRNSG